MKRQKALTGSTYNYLGHFGKAENLDRGHNIDPTPEGPYSLSVKQRYPGDVEDVKQASELNRKFIEEGHPMTSSAASKMIKNRGGSGTPVPGGLPEMVKGFKTKPDTEE